MEPLLPDFDTFRFDDESRSPVAWYAASMEAPFGKNAVYSLRNTELDTSEIAERQVTLHDSHTWSMDSSLHAIIDLTFSDTVIDLTEDTTDSSDST